MTASAGELEAEERGPTEASVFITGGLEKFAGVEAVGGIKCLFDFMVKLT